MKKKPWKNEQNKIPQDASLNNKLRVQSLERKIINVAVPPQHVTRYEKWKIYHATATHSVVCLRVKLADGVRCEGSQRKMRITTHRNDFPSATCISVEPEQWSSADCFHPATLSIHSHSTRRIEELLSLHDLPNNGIFAGF